MTGIVSVSDQTILWRRLDRPGHEAARVWSHESSWHLAGTAAFVFDQKPCRLDYHLICDPDWYTRSCWVAGWTGNEDVDIELSVNEFQHWRLNGQEISVVAGCLDLDLNFSPSTNLLPIQRLALRVGQGAAVKAAWLRFPSFELEPLEQVYRRLSDTTYRYESGGGEFVRELTVNPAGFVTHYPGLWIVETG
jgi:hypothetical protein